MFEKIRVAWKLKTLFSFTLGCGIGEISLNEISENRRYQSNGFTCTDVDGAGCSSGRYPEKRDCIPCDETEYKKPAGAKYLKSGSCRYWQSNV